MPRIAKIRFGRYGKLYDYLCPDPNINEESIVYIEGKERPYYVYAIENTTATLANKKVLGIAKENHNVTLSSRYMNIIDCSCECIVNSLDPKTNIYSDICKTIVEKAKSNDIDLMLAKHLNANIYDVFVTDAGNLPSKHIIHIVMPFKKDDRFNENLKKAFRLVINKAIENKYESIGIPYIGIGENGYSNDDIHDALSDVMFEYRFKEGIRINIVSIQFNPTLHGSIKTNFERGMNQRLQGIKGADIKGGFFEVSPNMLCNDDPTEEVWIVNKLIGDLYNKDEEMDMDLVINPSDFFKYIRKEKGYPPEVLMVLSETTISNIQKKKPQRYLKKIELFQLSIALGLNFTEIIQFMQSNSFSFSPLSESNLDYEFFKYIAMNNGIKSYMSAQDYFYDNCSKKVADLLFDTSNEKETV